MGADAEKSGKSGIWGKLEIWIGILVSFVILLASAAWEKTQPRYWRILSEGTVELHTNTFVMISWIMLCLFFVVLGFVIIWRRRQRGQQFALVELSIIMFGIMSGVTAYHMAVSSAIIFTPTEVTVLAPSWLGGESRAKLIYSQIDWLGTRMRIGWKRGLRGWDRTTVSEYLVKKKGGEETQVDLRWEENVALDMPSGIGAWNEILKAARSAGITVKPVERIISTEESGTIRSDSERSHRLETAKYCKKPDTDATDLEECMLVIRTDKEEFKRLNVEEITVNDEYVKVQGIKGTSDVAITYPTTTPATVVLEIKPYKDRPARLYTFNVAKPTN